MSISDESALREVVPEPPARAWAKERDHIGDGALAFLRAAPFAVMATSDADGRCDASPRGGPPGFAFLANPFVGLVFFVPGRRPTPIPSRCGDSWSNE